MAIGIGIGISPVLLGGGVVPTFWSGNPDLRVQNILQVSAYGDSITKGSVNVTASRIWTPEAAASIIALDAARTTTAGANIFDSANCAESAGASEAGGVHTLVRDGADANPRFLGLDPGTVAAGRLFRVVAEIDSTNSAGSHLCLRWAGYDPAIVITDRNFGGDNVSTAGYLELAGVISCDYALVLAPTVSDINIGGEIIGAVNGTGLIRNITFHQLSTGVAVVNQGTDGWDAGDGVANIANVTGWTPDVCVVAYGTNDIRAVGDVDANMVTYLSNLDSIIDALAAANIHPVLATLPPLASDQNNYTKVTQWNAAIRGKAITRNVGYWDRWTALNHGDLTYIDDGRHPTRAGYLLLASDLADRLRYG